MHSILFFTNKEKVQDDILVAQEHHSCSKLPLFFGWLYLMTWDRWFRNVFYHRIGKWRYLLEWIAPTCDSFIIGTYSDIGPALLAVHSYATYINAKKVGRNFVVKNCVTIGAKGVDEKPIIGDNVEINVNSVIFGDITIGSNVIIGAGTVLNKNVPDNSVVVGNPARIVKLNGNPTNVLL